jgi:hypothetical protein
LHATDLQAIDAKSLSINPTPRVAALRPKNATAQIMSWPEEETAQKERPCCQGMHVRHLIMVRLGLGALADGASSRSGLSST